jgi:hypothetical protein
MALLLHAKRRAYLQRASASKAEAQEVRFKENTDSKKRQGKRKENLYWLVFGPLRVAWFATVDFGMVLSRRSH